jgi:hypothetical protein
MSDNIYKNDRSKSLYSYISHYLGAFGIFLDIIFLKYVFMGGYVCLFIILNIANTHYNEKFIRHANLLQKEVDQLKVQYVSLQADYMTLIKQSKVAEKVASIGLIESDYPPFKIKRKTTEK